MDTVSEDIVPQNAESISGPDTDLRTTHVSWVRNKLVELEEELWIPSHQAFHLEKDEKTPFQINTRTTLVFLSRYLSDQVETHGGWQNFISGVGQAIKNVNSLPDVTGLARLSKFIDTSEGSVAIMMMATSLLYYFTTDDIPNLFSYMKALITDRRGIKDDHASFE